jgi:hypothetical protein
MFKLEHFSSLTPQLMLQGVGHGATHILGTVFGPVVHLFGCLGAFEHAR